MKTLEDLGIGNQSLNRPPISQETRTRSDKWDCMKLKVSAQQSKQLSESKDIQRSGKNFSSAIF
jgi:hypothetical protein